MHTQNLSQNFNYRSINAVSCLLSTTEYVKLFVPVRTFSERSGIKPMFNRSCHTKKKRCDIDVGTDTRRVVSHYAI